MSQDPATTGTALAPITPPPAPKLLKLLDNPAVRENYAQALAESGTPTPWTLEPDSVSDHPSVAILDAAGDEVAIIFRPTREHAQRIATQIIVAVNAVAMFSGMQQAPKSGVLADLYDGQRAA